MRAAVLIVIIIGLIIGLLSFWVNRSVSTASGTSSDTKTITVAAGEGVRDIAKTLKKDGFITSDTAWAAYVILTGRRSDILAGSYRLDHGMSGKQIAAVLTTEPNNDEEVVIKILEGATKEQIATQLEKGGVVSVADFLIAVQNTDSRNFIPGTYYEFLTDKPASAGTEGFLFPDTYRFFKDTTPAAALQKLLDNFDTKFTTDLRQKVKASGRTYYDTVIMASILEGELRSFDDRAKAADIFWRRIQAGMGLNADATVLYAVGKKAGALTQEDLEVDSPYNTYKYRGLPPGPIGNASFSALKAATEPQANEFWYYLSAPDGQTIFSKTLDEHNANVAKYLR